MPEIKAEATVDLDESSFGKAEAPEKSPNIEGLLSAAAGFFSSSAYAVKSLFSPVLGRNDEPASDFGAASATFLSVSLAATGALKN